MRRPSPPPSRLPAARPPRGGPRKAPPLPYPSPLPGAQAAITARTDSMPGRAATTRAMAVSSPSAMRRNAAAAPAAGPQQRLGEGVDHLVLGRAAPPQLVDARHVGSESHALEVGAVALRPAARRPEAEGVAHDGGRERPPGDGDVLVDADADGLGDRDRRPVAAGPPRAPPPPAPPGRRASAAAGRWPGGRRAAPRTAPRRSPSRRRGGRG